MEINGSKIRKLGGIGETVLMSLPKEIIEKFDLRKGDLVTVVVDDQYRMTLQKVVVTGG